MNPTPLLRLPDWAVRFQRLVAARLTVPFSWGTNDCFLFGADSVLAVSGQDVAADLRGAYSGERQARELLRRLGGMRGLGEARFGARTPPALCLPGDVGLAPQGRTVLMVVCNGVHWLAPTSAGLQPAPAPVRAWSISQPAVLHG